MWRRSREEIIEEVKRFAELAKALYPQIVKVILFGSVARDMHGPRSDVDILVLYEDREPDYHKLKMLASETIEEPVDLILLSIDSIAKLSEKAFREWIEEGVEVL